jgi:hypothetical protein
VFSDGLPYRVALLVACCACVSQDEEVPVTNRAPELVESRCIWNAAPHSAFTDLIRFEGGWLCCFREGERHVHGADGRIRVLASADGREWESVALLEEKGVDLRDPKLSVTPDGRAMLVIGGSIYAEGQLTKRRPRVAFSADGRQWGDLQPVLADGDWLWRVTWHAGRAYGVSYVASAEHWELKLFASEDGVDYELVTALDVPGRPNEATLRFLPDDTMQALVRREEGDKRAWFGTSRPPYTSWKWRPVGHRIGGPNLIVVPGRGTWVAGRYYAQDETGAAANRTMLGRLTATGFEPELFLPSGGDTSYPGLVWHANELWMSYYSSHEGTSSIYIARALLP